MSSVADEMVPKAVVDILMQQISTLQATVDRLNATIEEKDRIIAEKIEIILNQNRARFGQSSFFPGTIHGNFHHRYKHTQIKHTKLGNLGYFLFSYIR